MTLQQFIDAHNQPVRREVTHMGKKGSSLKASAIYTSGSGSKGSTIKSMKKGGRKSKGY